MQLADSIIAVRIDWVPVALAYPPPDKVVLLSRPKHVHIIGSYESKAAGFFAEDGDRVHGVTYWAGLPDDPNLIAEKKAACA